jgi:DNA polymerase-3 subunit delta
VSEASPVIYLLDGEDEFGISEFLARLQEKLGDPAMAEMNTTRLDGRSLNLDELVNAVSAMPFLTPRRLIILANPLARLSTPPQREKFKDILNQVPPTTALALVEYRLLAEMRDRHNNKPHWLEKWALEAGERVFIKHFPLPAGDGLAKWIIARAKAAGGAFTPQAAAALAELSGQEPRLADQEIHKLLAYVNYARPVEADDVESLTPSAAKIQDFALVNALRSRDRRAAQSILNKMLEKDDPLAILQQIVFQYRLLIAACDGSNNHLGPDEIARQLRTHAYPVKLALKQARHYHLADLEAIYHRLLELDEAIKTGQTPGELALEILVVRLTG